MDHRARDAPDTSRRTRGRPVPVAAAHQRTRLRTTNCKRTNLDVPGTDTNRNTHPTRRPHQQRTPTSNIRTTPGQKGAPTSNFRTTQRETKKHRQQRSGKKKTRNNFGTPPLTPRTTLLSLRPKSGQKVDSGKMAKSSKHNFKVAFRETQKTK